MFGVVRLVVTLFDLNWRFCLILVFFCLCGCGFVRLVLGVLGLPC